MDKKDDEFEELEVLEECTYMDDEFDIIAGITKAEVEYDFDEL